MLIISAISSYLFCDLMICLLIALIMNDMFEGFGQKRPFQVYLVTANYGLYRAVDLSSFGILSVVLTDLNATEPGIKTAHLYNLKGISLRLQGPMFKEHNLTIFIFQNSMFDLYDEQDSLIEADRCDVDYFQDKHMELFSGMEGIEMEWNKCKQ